MASGTLQAGAMLHYVDDVSERTFTLDGHSSDYPNGGYHNLANDTPSPASVVPAGAKIVAVGMVYWNYHTGPFTLIPYSNNQVYAIGTYGVTVNRLRCRFWYTF